MLRADGVERRLEDGRLILGPVSLDVAPGTLTAVVGPSGSGKTTLLRILAGIGLPTAGTVTLDGEPAERRVADLGYVPQRETVHDRLTVREALRYAAVLRLDPGEDPEARTAQVLAELDLERQADTFVGHLSGGERRRAACGLELVGRPQVLLLDEPTSGLDPVLERRLMLMFRSLADHGRAVVVTTHATESLELCDRVEVMFDGALSTAADAAAAIASLRRAGGADRTENATGTATARSTAEVPAGTAVTVSVSSTAAVPASAAVVVPAGAAPEASTGAADKPGPRRPFGLELRTLTERYARTLTRDTRTLAILLGQAPVIGILIALLFSGGAFARSGTEPANAVQLVFLSMTGAIWLGITAACREIVKERGIIEREFDVGLRADAYVAAKALVLFSLSTVQVLLMMLVLLALQPVHQPLGDVFALVGLAILTSWVSVALGLVVSAVARSVDQAAGVIPLVLIPQLLFAGALVPLTRLPGVAAAVAQLTYARWAYAGMGSAIDMQTRLANKPNTNAALGFSRSFFELRPGTSAIALVCFGLVGLGAAAALLQLRAPEDAV